MTVEALNCPNCGANLQIRADQTLSVCAYCNSNIRLTPPVVGSKDRVTIAEINWTVISDLPDERRLICDASFLLDIKYIRLETLPSRTVSSQTLMQILASETSHEFRLDDLVPSGQVGHYQAPHNILLNKRYIECLRQVKPEYGQLRLRGRGELEPVII
jgi:hypothetical protein